MKDKILTTLKTALLKWLSKIFSDLHSAVVGIVLLSAISSIGVLVYYFNNIWLAIKQTMHSPTPLWATTALVLVAVVYLYLKPTKPQARKTSEKEICFLTTNKLKWRVEIYKDYFTVDKFPFCAKHDVQFIFSSTKKYCPGTLNESCDNHLNDRDDFKVYEAVKSIIESKIRNGEELC